MDLMVIAHEGYYSNTIGWCSRNKLNKLNVTRYYGVRLIKQLINNKCMKCDGARAFVNKLLAKQSLVISCDPMTLQVK